MKKTIIKICSGVLIGAMAVGTFWAIKNKISEPETTIVQEEKLQKYMYENLQTILDGGEITAVISNEDADKVANDAAASVTKSIMAGEVGIDVEAIKTEIRNDLSKELRELLEGEDDNGMLDSGLVDLIAQQVYNKLNGTLTGKVSEAEINSIVSKAVSAARENTISEQTVLSLIKSEVSSATTSSSSGSAVTVEGASGDDGEDGADGQDGADGADGYTPVKGVDYMTDEDIAELQEIIISEILESGDLIVTGQDGADGADGLSAYEVAVEEGFEGTKAQWLASLKGATGATGSSGANGLSAYEIAVEEGFDGTQEEWLASLKGATGVTGAKGDQGLSAYEVAVEEGFEGTQAEWLESLKGDSADAIIAATTQYTSVEDMVTTLIETSTADVVTDMSEIYEILGDMGWNDNALTAGSSGPKGNPTITELINTLYEDYATYDYDGETEIFTMTIH